MIKTLKGFSDYHSCLTKDYKYDFVKLCIRFQAIAQIALNVRPVSINAYLHELNKPIK